MYYANTVWNYWTNFFELVTYQNNRFLTTYVYNQLLLIILLVIIQWTNELKI